MTELEKIKHLLKHWMEHNDAHVKTYSEWAEKAERCASVSQEELAANLIRVAVAKCETEKKAQLRLESISRP